MLAPPAGEEADLIGRREALVDFRDLVGIVLSHGAEVRVVEPVELNNLVRAEIERMGVMY